MGRVIFLFSIVLPKKIRVSWGWRSIPLRFSDKEEGAQDSPGRAPLSLSCRDQHLCRLPHRFLWGWNCSCLPSVHAQGQQYGDRQEVASRGRVWGEKGRAWAWRDGANFIVLRQRKQDRSNSKGALGAGLSGFRFGWVQGEDSIRVP